jgi:patatin-related protein
MQVRKEIRFAIVLYGGISLAVYINGVVRELLAMVRATAPDAEDPDIARFAFSELGETEKVYRQLGQVLNADRDPLASTASRPVPNVADPIRTRFVVDIISGTSAGGINGLYLAKALVLGQSLERIANVWLDKADISTLLYDKYSALPGIPQQRPPPSLLNGRRMFYLLFDSLQKMDDDAGASERKRSLTDRVDCFLTATDLRGLPIFLRLSDGFVSESWHRKSFHFSYDSSDKGEQDFAQPWNPILAFAARCTSSFPTAFEPVMIGDIKSVLGENLPVGWKKFFGEYIPPGIMNAPGASVPQPPDAAHDVAQSEAKKAPGFDEGSGRDQLNRAYDVEEHAFADGGALDNKPFSYAITALGTRRATVPSERKLVYIEPSPEHPEDAPAFASAAGKDPRRPTFVETTADGLFLARRETIRQELDRISARNRLIDRVDRIVSGVDDDLAIAAVRSCDPPPSATATVEGKDADTLNRQLSEQATRWSNEPLTAMIEKSGPGYGGYFRLKVAAVTDDLAAIIASLAGFVSESDEYLAVRYLVRAWRDAKYSESPLTGQLDSTQSQPIMQQSQNAYLFSFDLGYRLRRLDFVLAKIDTLSCLDEHAERIVSGLCDNARVAFPGLAEDAAVATRLAQLRKPFATWTREEREEFRVALVELAKKLAPIYHRLRAFEIDLQSPSGEGNTDPKSEGDAKAKLIGAVLATKVTRSQLQDLMGLPTDVERDMCARRLIGVDEQTRRLTKESPFISVEQELSKCLEPQLIEASNLAIAVLLPGADARPNVKDLIAFYYHRYECFDEVTFPIRFATDVGEELDPVAVVRISPEDGRFLVKERTDINRPTSRMKLAGIRYGHFGAFFDRGWRQNDLTWGRLDGAERLITTALAGSSSGTVGVATRWIHDAQEEIFRDLAERGARDSIADELIRAIAQVTPTTQTPATHAWGTAQANAKNDANAFAVAARTKRRIIENLTRPATGAITSTATASLRNYLQTPAAIQRAFVEGTNVAPEMNRHAAIDAIGRGVGIVGLILKDLSREYNAAPVRRVASAFSMLSQTMWGVVALATPESGVRPFLRHWQVVASVAAALILAAGFVFPYFQGLRTLGLTILIGIILIQIISVTTHAWMVGRFGASYLLSTVAGWLLVIVTLFLIMSTVLELPRFVADARNAVNTMRSPRGRASVDSPRDGPGIAR